MTRTTDSIGAYGERVAASALTDAGMLMLDRNWRCASGELDIVARDEDVIVFCEQKLRDLRHRTPTRPRVLPERVGRSEGRLGHRAVTASDRWRRRGRAT